MNESDLSIDPQALRERSTQLAQVAAELKQELFGIDSIIDRVIESVRAWYVMPQLITRPVVVCLWGLTGTGKTQLTRRLAQKLGFYDRFVEVQMDGFSNGSSWRSRDSISAMLAESSIAEGEPGILVLDEFQRFRTVTKNGDDAPVRRYQDVWQLLSDGKLPPALSFLRDLEDTLAQSQYEAQCSEDDDEDQGEDAKNTKKKSTRPFKISPWAAREIARSLKLKDPLQTVMAWSAHELQSRVLDYKQQASRWETDYSRLLIIVSGNLDEMYNELAQRVQDCDTDADVFHKLSQQLSVIDVKKALNKRFRPEQVARLGNTHIIYPSLNQATYLRLIQSVCASYVNELEQRCGYRIVLDDSVTQAIYSNGVFPAQGTRPLFSSVHAILSAPLVNAALWAAGQGLPAGEMFWVRLDAAAQTMQVSCGPRALCLPIALDIENIRRRASENFRALLAVHEAGHGLAYACLFGHAPQEVKINVASFEGGYNSYVRLQAESRQSVLDRICVSLAGRAAETLVFGADACSTGSFGDIKQATQEAARFVRHYGFAGRLSHTDVADEADQNMNTDVGPTNAQIEAVLAEQLDRALALVRTHAGVLMRVVDELLARGEVHPARMAQLLTPAIPVAVTTGPMIPTPYAQRLKAFAAEHKLIEHMADTPAKAAKEQPVEA
jgi:SpoVK/Ycf46/Vps4 family AAA+-type ATPase